MLLHTHRKHAASSIMLMALGFAMPAVASCGQAGNEHSIRHAVDAGSTIVISSRGTSIERAPAPRIIGHTIARPLALKVAYNGSSGTFDESALKDLVNQAVARRKTIDITVIAFLKNDPCAAEAVAQGRAASLRSMLLKLGAPPSQLRIRAAGGRSGHDRAEFRLAPAGRTAPRI